MQYKLKHRLSAALMAGAMCCTMIPAASADEIATPETVDTAVPEVTDSVTPALSQITENLYNDLPDAPTGSYLGSMGLPVATGETKISISAWVSDLYDGTDAHMDADALNGNESTVIVGRNPDADYAVVPLLVQTEYPANSATAEVVLPKGVEVLSYASTDADLISADDAEQAKILHQTYAEQSAAATGFYVKAFSDFTAQLFTPARTAPLYRNLFMYNCRMMQPLHSFMPITVLQHSQQVLPPPYATGKITSIAKEGGTWLIWFNGQEAYCCSHGLNGQPNGCPTYTFDHVFSPLSPAQYTPGNHYANQINIWGGLGQLSLDMLDSKPVVMSADTEQPDLISESTMKPSSGSLPTILIVMLRRPMLPPPKNWQTARRCSLVRTVITLTFIIRPQATHGRLWRWLVRKLLAAPKFRTCRVLLSRSIILLHGPLLHRAPEAALI